MENLVSFCRTNQAQKLLLKVLPILRSQTLRGNGCYSGSRKEVILPSQHVMNMYQRECIMSPFLAVVHISIFLMQPATIKFTRNLISYLQKRSYYVNSKTINI